jgi:hypothetical protein
MDTLINERIGEWIARAHRLQNQGLHDEFIRFFIYYMCLDAWMTSESGQDLDKQKLAWLLKDGGLLKKVFASKEFNMHDTASLKALSPIVDMRPGHEAQPVHLHDAENLEEVVNFIYQIRCNLFHGGKSPASGRDSDLVFFAGEFLKNWIGWAHSKENQTRFEETINERT